TADRAEHAHLRRATPDRRWRRRGAPPRAAAGLTSTPVRCSRLSPPPQQSMDPRQHEPERAEERPQVPVVPAHVFATQAEAPLFGDGFPVPVLGSDMVVDMVSDFVVEGA